ncbi:hypothetical protein BGW39_006680 [Mortierella sp. 14UC]|nr:hypothetical protein BGW39_006680 [Mortierella sp. 14UC]
MAQYEALSGAIKAMMTLELRAVYERIEDMLQEMEGGDKQAVLNAEKQEKEVVKINAAIDELFGDLYKLVVEAVAENDKERKKKQQELTIDLDLLLDILDTIGSAGTIRDAAKEQKQEASKEKKSGAQVKV